MKGNWSTPPDGHDQEDLLPGWSSLLILLTIFAILSAVTLFAILRGHDAGQLLETGGTEAYSPADLAQVEFDEPLLASVLEAGPEDQTSSFDVPPPPFSEDGIFPCSDCHADLDVDPEPRELGFHEEIELSHGPERWCLDCHDADDRDGLRLASGGRIEFTESYRLCGQCHGTIYRDWRSGIHGQRRGFWSGAKSYLLCAHCHDPHSPRFHELEPLPPPVRPEFLRTAERSKP